MLSRRMVLIGGLLARWLRASPANNWVQQAWRNGHPGT